ncbi:type 1 fimbrial protein [Pseudomonas mucidolens]|uniref:type 1 fimbrial protein n=1 Tax=Pseudomonas mucidolens TaxID=46679 RepID=UPI0030DCF2F8
MNSPRLAAGISLCFVLVSGSCLAATGVIQFHGSIVEPACQTASGTGATVAFSECPGFARTATISANSVEPTRKVSAPDGSPVNLKLLLDTAGQDRYFERHYLLSDAAGKPLQSGAYLVTLTYP